MPRRRVNYARLNYLLIPQNRSSVEAAQQAWVTRWVLSPLFTLLSSFTAAGHILILLSVLAAGLAVDIHNTWGFVLFSLLAGVLCSALVLRFCMPGAALNDLQLSISHTPVITAGEQLPVHITLTNRGSQPMEALRIRFTMLSWDGHWLGFAPSIASIAPGQQITVQRSARFDARGEKFCGPIGVAELLPGGLSQGRTYFAEQVQVTVLPRITTVALAPTLLQRGQIAPDQQPHGPVSEAAELRGVRPYRAGDPVRDLHAATWARTGEPHVREYHEPVVPRTTLLIDTDSTQSNEYAFEAMLSLAAGIVAAYETQGQNIVLLPLGGINREDLREDTDLSPTSAEQNLVSLATLTPAPLAPVAELTAMLNKALGRASQAILVTLISPVESADSAEDSETATERQYLNERCAQAGIPFTCCWIHDEQQAPELSASSASFQAIDTQLILDGATIPIGKIDGR